MRKRIRLTLWATTYYPIGHRRKRTSSLVEQLGTQQNGLHNQEPLQFTSLMPPTQQLGTGTMEHTLVQSKTRVSAVIVTHSLQPVLFSQLCQLPMVKQLNFTQWSKWQHALNHSEMTVAKVEILTGSSTTFKRTRSYQPLFIHSLLVMAPCRLASHKNHQTG